MKNIDEIPNIKKEFKEENLCEQYVYKAKESYNVVYINPKLYEEIFEEEYEWEKASRQISKMFSITLDEEKSNKQIIGKAFSDKQLDPTGMALSGNLGSGRAYFYGSKFNIKGDKTKLATSPKSIYSNGKYALSAAIKETVISNILADDFAIPTFESLAILETKEKFDFIDEYMDSDDIIRAETYNLPCCIEIRVNKDKELYRISNSLINKDTFTIKDAENFCEKLAKIEANKFCDRFLHGSWSVGNISTKGNLIDFDTAAFVKGRFPQYSNTNKYKSNYQIEKAVKENKIFKIEKGIYANKRNVHFLEVIVKKYPKAIITGESAYYYHNLTDVIPDRIYLATNRTAVRINNNKIKQISVSDNLFELGKETLVYEGATINIYNKERMLIDLAKNKNQIGYDLYKEIISNYRKLANSLDTQKIEEYLQYFVNGDKIFEIIQDEVF